MRIALIADVHANLAALDAVLADAGSLGAEAVWQMGDVVGYGPHPNEVIRRLVECRAAGVAGNHDAAAVGELGLEEFNDLAAEANRWTARVLTPESIEYLKVLPEVDVDGTCAALVAQELDAPGAVDEVEEGQLPVPAPGHDATREAALLARFGVRLERGRLLADRSYLVPVRETLRRVHGPRV